jgi:(5-formylfuran-3-yl)methyl phosphate synthase
MTRFLASVRDPAEAETVLAAGADIVDLKDPAHGALGAVAAGTIEACVTRIAGRAPVSATVGDLPMQPEIVCDAVAATAALGVDDVKLGLTPGGDPETCFARLRAMDLPSGLILVVFADARPAFDPVEAALQVGARGLMLDTAGKGEGALPDHMSIAALGAFVEAARAAGLMAGLAGSLEAAHVPPLLALKPDVIGFRGALCRDGLRNSGLDRQACRRIRALIPAGVPAAEGRFGEPRAAALC